jgi:hypothetical protein
LNALSGDIGRGSQSPPPDIDYQTLPLSKLASPAHALKIACLRVARAKNINPVQSRMFLIVHMQMRLFMTKTGRLRMTANREYSLHGSADQAMSYYSSAASFISTPGYFMF